MEGLRTKWNWIGPKFLRRMGQNYKYLSFYVGSVAGLARADDNTLG